jgi:benzoyl-CoA reductase/2-hydroxyglutaryl-CoA dehydratase subunit BcrC/BadD/HgdB
MRELTWLEREIERNQKRLARIESNPDPRMLKSNKLLYEMELDLRRAQLEAWRTRSKPLANSEYATLLINAMGFVGLDLMSAADRTRLASDYFSIIRANGFPDTACDRTIVCLAMCINKDFPPPDIVLAHNTACHMEMMSFKAIGEHCKAPVFTLNAGLGASEDTLQFVTEQLAEFIEFAEARVPRAHYDEERMVELIGVEIRALDHLREINKLRSHVPCLMSGQDAFRLPRFPSYYPDPHGALRYFEAWRNEMMERAEQGVGALEDEKLRLLWVVTGPFYFNPFRVLAERGVAVPALQFGWMTRVFGIKYHNFGDETEYGRKLSPLEEQARFLNSNSWGVLGETWVVDTLDACRNLKVDGMVYYSQVGCTASAGLGRMVAERAEKELEIPTLIMEGRQLDAHFKTQEACEAELDTFVDLCLSRKGA